MSIRIADRRATITVDGPLDPEQTIAFVAEHYPTGDFDDAMWDLRQAPLVHLKADELRRIADAVRAHSLHRKGSRTVFVRDDDAGYGMLRMYTAYAEMEGVPASYFVCRSMDEALAWLDAPGRAGRPRDPGERRTHGRSGPQDHPQLPGLDRRGRGRGRRRPAALPAERTPPARVLLGRGGGHLERLAAAAAAGLGRLVPPERGAGAAAQRRAEPGRPTAAPSWPRPCPPTPPPRSSPCWAPWPPTRARSPANASPRTAAWWRCWAPWPAAWW